MGYTIAKKVGEKGKVMNLNVFKFQGTYGTYHIGFTYRYTVECRTVIVLGRYVTALYQYFTEKYLQNIRIVDFSCQILIIVWFH